MSLKSRLQKKFGAVADNVSRIGKTVIRKAAKVGSVAAPIAGGLLFGPVGSLVGGAIGAGLSQVGPTKNTSLAFQRSFMATGASFAGSGLLSLFGGGGLTTGVFSNLSSIFGGGGAAPGGAPAATEDDSFLTFGSKAGQPTVPGTTPPAGGGGLLSTLFGGPAAPGATTPGTTQIDPTTGQPMQQAGIMDFVFSPVGLAVGVGALLLFGGKGKSKSKAA